MTIAVLTALAGAGSAPAAALYSGSKMLEPGSNVEAVGSKIVFKAGFATLECGRSEVIGTTENTGSSTQAVTLSISSMALTECSGTSNVLKKGAWIFHWAGESNGTVTSEGWEWTIAFSGTSCTYGTPTATDFGPLKGGSPARLNMSAALTRVAGGFLCANPATMTASYTFEEPNPLHVTAS